MQSFYPPRRDGRGQEKREDKELQETEDVAGPARSSKTSVADPEMPSLPRRGHSGLVSQAAAAAAASGSTTSYCSPALWLGSDRLSQSSAQISRTGKLIPAPKRSQRPKKLVGDTLEVTYQERLTGFGPDQMHELVELIESKHTQFSALSLCTALHRLASNPACTLQLERFSGLVSTLEAELRTRPDRFRAQSIANSCWAVAKLYWKKSGLLEALLETAVSRIEEFKGQELSLLLWSMATGSSKTSHVEDAANASVCEFLRRGSSAFDAQSTATVAYAAGALVLSHEPLWEVLGTGSATRVSEFSDRQLANLLWGFATVSYTDCEVVFQRVASDAPIATLAPIDLSLVAWSLAKVSHKDKHFYDQVADAIVAKQAEWRHSDTRNIATLLYSLALSEQAISHDSAFRELATAVRSRASEFSVQGLTNAVWAYATACYTEELWFRIVAKEVSLRKKDEFEPLDVANTLWAFAAVLHHDNVISFLTSLGKGMIWQMSGQNVAIAVWSLASLELRGESFFHQAADPFVQRLSECKAQELNNMLWAYATACVRLPWLFLKSANHALTLGLTEFKTHELSIMLWAHGTAGVCNHTFFNEVVDEILGGRGIESCAPREIANAAWAYSTIIGRCHLPWMTAVAAYSQNHIREFDMQGIGNVLWSFANVAIHSERLLRVACEETSRRCASGHRDEAAHNAAQVLSAVQATGVTGLAEIELCKAAIDLFLEKGFGNVGAREFLILGNAALSFADQLEAGWKNLTSVLERHVFDPLAEAILHGDWSSVETCISQLDIDHLGAGFTADFLRRIGISSVQVYPRHEAGGWVEEAVHACALERERAIQAGIEEDAPVEQQKLVRQLDKVNKREIVAWVRFQVSSSVGEHKELGRAFGWRLEAEISKLSPMIINLLRPMVTKSRIAPNMIGEHDRSGHAERSALLHIAADWLQEGHPERGLDFQGKIYLYVTHYPCISCICVIAQFKRLFPKLQFHLAYADGRAINIQFLENKIYYILIIAILKTLYIYS